MASRPIVAVTLAILHHLLIHVADAQVVPAASPKATLLQHLLTNYNKNVMPTWGADTQITLHAHFVLKNVLSLDEKNQQMTSFGWLGLVWQDELLRWDPADYNGTATLIIPPHLIWLPEVAMLNSVEQGDDLSMVANFRAKLFPDGSVFWGPGFKWKTSCKVDLAYFPYDEQTCSVKFTNWVHSAELLNYTVVGVSQYAYTENDEWQLTNMTSGTYSNFMEGFEAPVMYFTVHLKRQPAYYIMNVLLPCVIVTILSALVFALPIESGEKISLAITTSLSYTVILLIVSDISPKGSSTLPLISIYIALSMTQTALALVTTVAILSVHHHSPDTPVPHWLRSLVLQCLASMLRMRSSVPNGGSKVQPMLGHDGKVPLTANEALQVEDLEQKIKNGGLPSGNDVTLPHDVMQYVRTLKEKDAEAEAQGRNKANWGSVAKILDRFFLIVFFTTIFAEGVTLTIMTRYGG